MAAARPHMSSGILFPATVTKAYSRPSIINSRQPHVVSWGTLRGEYPFPRANWLSSRSLFNGLVIHEKSPVLGLAGSSDRSNTEEDKYLIPRLSRTKFRVKINEWADKQCLPVGAVCYGVYSGLEMFVYGFLVKIVQERLMPFAFSELELELAGTGAYYPLLISFAKSPLICGLNAAVLTTSMTIIAYIIKRLVGKKSYVQRDTAAGFGGGVMLSLVTGMRGPSVISIGVIWGLLLGLGSKLAGPDYVKADEKLSQSQLAEDKNTTSGIK